MFHFDTGRALIHALSFWELAAQRTCRKRRAGIVLLCKLCRLQEHAIFNMMVSWNFPVFPGSNAPPQLPPCN